MKSAVFISIIISSIIAFSACNNASQKQNSTNSSIENLSIEPTYKIILASEVEWTHLNPKRGDLAPKAGTLWGDRSSKEPTGFLLKPTDGFKSPPHIHNISYRGVVINGLFHNDDPNATNMWMPQGSFWTQPKGEIHITAAEGSNSLAYIEIEEGPCLVLPEEEHFESGERPLNLEHSNIVWIEANDVKWLGNASANNETKIAFLWGEPVANNLNGTFLSLPPKFNGKIITNKSPFRAVVIKGNAQYHEPSEEHTTDLPAGSFFSSEKKSYHALSNNSDEEVIIYIRSYGTYEIL